MGKKKKAKLSKGDISVVSKGFDSIDDYEREELLSYFDRMKLNMENGKDVSDIIQNISSVTPKDVSVGVKEFASELEAFICREESTDEHNDDNVDVAVMVTEKEVVSLSTSSDTPNEEIKDTAEELKKMEKCEEAVILEKPVQQKPDNWWDNLNAGDFENTEDPDNVFVPDVNYGLIVENDNELLTVTSRFKSACTIDLYDMKKEGIIGPTKWIDDELKSVILMNINTLVKGMMYPDFLMKYNDFVDKVIKTGAIIPDDVYVRTAIGLDGTSYIGMFRFDQDDYDESIDDLCEYIDKAEINFFQVIIQVINSIGSIAFHENECERYFTKNRINLNREITNLFIEYCTDNGTSVIDTDDDQIDIVGEFFKKMSDNGRLINQAIIRDAATVIQNILIGDEDEVHEPVVEYDEVEEVDEFPDDYEVKEESESDEFEDYDTVESDSIGSSVFSDAIKKSGFSAVVDDDESEKDTSWVYTPHTKPGR